MDKYILNDLSWDNLSPINWKSVEKTFEFLCADFMQTKYDLDRVPLPSQNDNYPGLEGETVKKDNLYYWYQAKYWDNAFVKDKWFEESFSTIKEGLTNDIYEIDILCLFSRKEYPTNSRQKREANLKAFENSNNLIIHRYFWNNFLSELKKIEYTEILCKYFLIDEIKEEVYRKCKNKNDICNSRLNYDINNVTNWFKGNYSIDIEKARLYQKKYSYKKLSYSSYSFILDKFEKVERAIADEIFDELELWIYSSLDNYIDRCKKNLEDTDSKNEYKIELESIMNYKKWIFVNYWTQWLSCLNYIKKNKIKFKNKRYEWDI